MPEAARQILLIEDNVDDVFLMRRAVKKAGVPWNVQVARDGQQALDYLAGAENFIDRDQFPLPSLIFLDLKLPYLSGFEVHQMDARPAIVEKYTGDDSHVLPGGAGPAKSR